MAATPNRHIVVAVLIMVQFGLGGCAAPGPDRAALARQALIGLPKDALLSCAGVPARSAVIDNRDWFTYHSESVRTYPGMIYGGLGYFDRGPLDYDPPEISSVSCDATFTLRSGRVERLDFNSPQGTVANSQCGAIVANCLALTPTPAAITPPGSR